MCEYLLSLGAEVRVEPMSGLSPVHIACLAGHLDCVDVLLKVLLNHVYHLEFNLYWSQRLKPTNNDSLNVCFSRSDV